VATVPRSGLLGIEAGDTDGQEISPDGVAVIPADAPAG
jgi:hypothetical protein